MSLGQAALVVAGAIGGAIYPLIGYYNAKRIEKDISFDLSRFITPVVYGAITGVIGVFLSPMLGLGEIVDFNSAVSVGMGGAVLIEKLLNSEKGDLSALVDKIKG